ncbi:MAG: cytochrome b561 [Paracoccaceae bacterium]|jgi:cytochrome b561
MKNPSQPEGAAPHWRPAQRALHWAVVLMIALAAPLGWAIVNLQDAEVRSLSAGGLGVGDLYWWHKSFGFLVLGLMCARLAARLIWPKPPYAEPLPRASRIVSHSLHLLFYPLLIVLPLLGWAGVSAYGPDAATVFGLTMPDLLSPDRDLSKTLLDAHGFIAIGVMGLIAVHIAGAAFHGLIKRDGVFQRMTGGS